MIHELIIPILMITALVVVIEKRYSPRLDFSRDDYFVIWYTNLKGERVFKIIY